MGQIGPMEIAIVAIIALIVFGPNKLPELGSSLGKGMREFKSSISGEDSESSVSARIESMSADNQHQNEKQAAPEVEDATIVEDPKPIAAKPLDA